MRSLLLLLFSLGALLSFWALSPSALEAQGGKRIVSITIQNGFRISPDEIRKVLPFHEGDPFEPARLEQAVSTLKKWGRFEDIEVNVSPMSGGVAVTLTLKEGLLVSGIDIYATYPFLSARLRRILTVHSGDLYDPDTALEQKHKLEAFYERRGFAGTEVTLTPKSNGENGTVDLVYRIRKGHRYRIGKITVLGNTVFPPGYFVSKLNPLIPYEPGRMRKKLDQIRDDYKDNGYLKARVRLKDLGRDEATRKINPVLEVSEGKDVTVLFEGNRLVSLRTFKKIMPMFTEGGYGSYEIEASEQAILDHYQRLGFQETTVTSSKADRNDRGILVTFKIHEGPRTRVKKIEIEGNQEIGDGRIKKKLMTKENNFLQGGFYQPKTVQQDFNDLPKILQNRGALDGKAVDYKTSLNQLRDKVHVTFDIEEGEITKLTAIQFTGNDHFPRERLRKLLKLRVGDPFSPEKLTSDKERLVLFYANLGHPYMTLTHELLREGGKATLIFHIHEGIETRIGEILMVGNERTGKKALRRSMFLREGSPFSYKKILESESALRRTGSFRSIRIETIGLAEKEPVIHLVVKLEEYRKILLDFGVTYDTDNGFTGTMTLSHLNLGGTLRRGNLKLTGGRDIQKGEIILKDPYLFGYHLEASMTGLLERQSRPGFTTIDTGGSLAFLRELTPLTTFLGRYELIRTFFTDVTDLTGATEEDHTTSKFSFSLSHDKRDSFSDPHRGFIAFTGFDISNKLIAANNDFIQPKGYFGHYFPMGKRLTLLNYFRAEGIKVFGSGALTRDERLYLGGDYSVRGYDEDAVGPIDSDGKPAGGQLLFAYTSELQAKLFNSFKLALFLDNGSVTNTFSEFGLGSLRHSGGFGLRYITPVGPLRLDYGIKLDRQVGESFGRLHFAFGYSF